jgi:DNA transformation protein
MAFIRHVAIASKDPASTAEFYKKHFDLNELYRQPKDTGDDGVWLSDGYIYFAILKHGPNTPQLGPEQASDYCGIHHIGFMVDDQRAKVAELEAANVPYVQAILKEAAGEPDQERTEREVHRPRRGALRRCDGLERGDPLNTQLYELSQCVGPLSNIKNGDSEIKLLSPSETRTTAPVRRTEDGCQRQLHEFLREQRAAQPRHNAAHVQQDGVFCDGVMFRMVTDNMLYLQVDDHNRAAFKEAGSVPPSAMRSRGDTIDLSFLARRAVRRTGQFVTWARSALAAARRVAAKRTAPSEIRALRLTPSV